MIFIPMRKIPYSSFIPSLVLALLAVQVLGLSSGPQAKKREAIITYVRGDVEKKLQKKPDWTKAELQAQVIGGDAVRTLVESRSEVQLADKTLLRMDEKSTIEIRELEKSAAGVDADIALDEGDVWTAVGNPTSGKFSVASKVAGASVRGTIFRVSVEEDQSTQVRVYKGEVEVYNPLAYEKMEEGSAFSAPREVLPGFKEISREEWVYMIGAMQQISISGGGELESKGKFSASEKDEQSEWVKWNKERDAKLFSATKEATP